MIEAPLLELHDHVLTEDLQMYPLQITGDQKYELQRRVDDDGSDQTVRVFALDVNINRALEQNRADNRQALSPPPATAGS